MTKRFSLMLMVLIVLASLVYFPATPTAQAASPAYTYTGTIASAAQYDLYSLPLTAGMQITATLVCDEIAPGDRPLDPVLSVYFPGSDPSDAGNADVYNDDGFGLDDASDGVDCNAFDSSRVLFVAPTTATYTFRADGFGSSTGPYTLRIYISVGCVALMPLPLTAVVGTFVSNATLYWRPGELVQPQTVIEAGKSAHVLGVDATGTYYKIMWSCNFLWVDRATLGPNFDATWQGKPLPTGVVSDGVSPNAGGGK